MHLLKLQQQFRDALYQKSLSLPRRVSAPQDSHQLPDLSIYQNNLYNSLYQNLSHKFKMTKRWIGEDQFFQACKQYIFNFPQSSPYLCEYGQGFSSVLGDDLARSLSDLEWHMNLSLIAYREESSLKIEDFLSVHPSMMSGLVFRLHSSVHLYVGSYPLKDIWMKLEKKEDIRVSPESSHFFVGATSQKSFFFSIDQREYESLRMIKEGKSLGDVYELLRDVHAFQELLNKFIPYFVEIKNKFF